MRRVWLRMLWWGMNKDLWGGRMCGGWKKVNRSLEKRKIEKRLRIKEKKEINIKSLKEIGNYWK